MLYTPSQVAKRAAIHPNSVRNWSKEYAEFFSPEARGDNGPRLFVEADVEVMCAIAALRKSGVPSGEVPERLRRPAPTIIDIAPTPQPTSISQATQTPQDITLALHAIQSSLQSQIDTQNADIRSLRADMRQQREDRATWLIIGFALAIVLVAVALWLG